MKEKADYEKKVKYLEEELMRKDDIIEALRKENNILLKTVFKNSERKLETKLKQKVDKKDSGKRNL